jgi:hypothetical protein
MKFAQEEWQCVVVGHVKQRFFFWRSSSLENLHTCVEETLEGFKQHRTLIVTFVLID